MLISRGEEKSRTRGRDPPQKPVSRCPVFPCLFAFLFGIVLVWVEVDFGTGEPLYRQYTRHQHQRSHHWLNGVDILPSLHACISSFCCSLHCQYLPFHPHAVTSSCSSFWKQCMHHPRVTQGPASGFDWTRVPEDILRCTTKVEKSNLAFDARSPLQQLLN